MRHQQHHPIGRLLHREVGVAQRTSDRQRQPAHQLAPQLFVDLQRQRVERDQRQRERKPVAPGTLHLDEEHFFEVGEGVEIRHRVEDPLAGAHRRQRLIVGRFAVQLQLGQPYPQVIG